LRLRLLPAEITDGPLPTASLGGCLDRTSLPRGGPLFDRRNRTTF